MHAPGTARGSCAAPIQRRRYRRPPPASERLLHAEDRRFVTALRERSTTIAAAAVPGGTGRRPDVIERTLARTAQSDIPAALATARDELMPYLRPGGGAPKPRPEAYAHADIPPELLSRATSFASSLA